MKYKIGDKFILKTSLGDKITEIVDIKYEFKDYIYGGPKYVNEDGVEGFMISGILRIDGEDKPLPYGDEYLEMMFKKWATVELRLQIEEMDKEDKEYLSKDEELWLRSAKKEMKRREMKNNEGIEGVCYS